MGVVIAINLALVGPARPAEPPDYSGFDPSLLDPLSLQVEDSAFIADSNPLGEIILAEYPDDFAGFILADMSSYLNTSPATNTSPSRNGLLVYRISDGDSLSTIAAHFGISVNTILWANSIRNSNLIKLGQEIVILPTSGVLHEVKTGETLDSIAALYKISTKEIATFNKVIKEGDTVIIPNAKPVKKSSYSSNLPSVSHYLDFPVKGGWNWGILHDNAVDISSACGSAIYASAEGLVVETGSPNNWNKGYGGFVKIKHPLYGVETLYAHTSANLVSVGDYIKEGKTIAKIGKTGLVQGPTGCHVHFAVFGARHPFAK